MKFTTSTALLAAAAGLQGVSAAGRLGFALGTKRPDGSCKVQADYNADLEKIHTDSGSTIVRIYAASDCNAAAEVLPAAKAQGFQVVLGIWPDVPESYEADKNAILTYTQGYIPQVYAVTIGSEALYRGTFTAQGLVDKINDMRSAAPHFRYGTADSWNKYADGTADLVVRASDILLCNAFAYWQGAAIGEAVGVFNSDIEQAYDHINGLVGGKELWVGETGWPSQGTTYQNAVPTLENARTFYRNGICAAHARGWKVFAFEAYDEPWKPDSTGEDGSTAIEKYWGVMSADRQDKYPLRC